MPELNADEIKKLLQLERLTIEGGYFRETYRSRAEIPHPALSSGYNGSRAFATAIYYLLTPDTFSVIHRVPGEEIFHFYLGDPVEMLQLHPDGRGEIVTLGTDIRAGKTPQHIVPGGIWQGARLTDGGRFALLGTTMSPGFDYADYQTGNRDTLICQFPRYAEEIRKLTRDDSPEI